MSTGDSHIVLPGELEVRKRGTFNALGGKFPYSKTATVRDRGRVRKERVAPNGFGWQIRKFAELQEQLGEAIEAGVDAARVELLQEELQRRNVHVLSGHDFNKPLGDMLSGTAKVTSTREALEFEVTLPAEDAMPTYMVDTVRQVQGGLLGGVSPGFRVPPATAVANAEELIPEPGNEGVMIRQINQAVLYEISLVTRPAYPSTDVEMRRESERQRAGGRLRRWL